MTATFAFALWATVAATGGPGVPPPVVAGAKALVRDVLVDVKGDVSLRLFRTAQEMHAAVARVDVRRRSDFGAYYHYRSRTLFAYMTPRPEATLWRDGLTGALAGALAHEAQHARGALSNPSYGQRPSWRIEGEADRDAVLFLARQKRPAWGAWEWLLQSRVHRGERAKLFVDADVFRKLRLDSVRGAARTTFYAQAYRDAGGRLAPLDWIVVDGIAEPQEHGFRVIAEEGRGAIVLRVADTTRMRLRIDVLPVGKRQVDFIYGYRSRTNYNKVAWYRGNRLRWMTRRGKKWRYGPIQLIQGPKNEATWEWREKTLYRGQVRQMTPPKRSGKKGIGTHNSAAKVTPN